MSLAQAVLVLQFNEATTLTFSELKDRTGLESPELVRNLQSLACGKVRVLTKTPKGKDVNETDSFGVNESFRHDSYRIKINTVQLKESKEEQQETSERIMQDRLYAVCGG